MTGKRTSRGRNLAPLARRLEGELAAARTPGGTRTSEGASAERQPRDEAARLPEPGTAIRGEAP
jgi:hypothetical protein